MGKKAVNLLRMLQAQSFEEVKEMLRLAGYDVDSPSFGPLSEVDDATIEKLKQISASKKAEKVKPTSKRIKRAEAKATAEVIVPTKLREILKTSPAESEAVEALEIPAEEVTTKPPRLKPILEEKKAPKVKLEKARKKKEKVLEEPLTDETPVEEVIEEEDELLIPGLRKEEVEEPLVVRRERRLTAEEAFRAKPRPRERRPVHAIKEILSEEEGVVTSRKRIFKVKGLKRKEPPQEVHKHVRISRPMSIGELSAVTGLKVSKIIQFLFEELDVAANINYVASIDEIVLICDKFQIECEVRPEEEPEKELDIFGETKELNLQPRPPIITVMGHVDHGKTKLLDYIRRTNVVEQESGGITQHIGAYQADVNGNKITFIDTPGHEAFTAMRARGSQVTDIVVLVVSADDGVMPQTIEALEHAKAANVPIIVAVNKIDKPEANPEKVRHQLAKAGLVPEEWGGDTIFVNVSALTGQGIPELLEMILMQAELMNLRADPSAPPYGTVLESLIDPGLGIVATILVQQGTFEQGMYVLSGESVGRIRLMLNEHGQEINRATPSTPVRIVGFATLPENGDKVYGFRDKRKAEHIAEARKLEREEAELRRLTPKVSLDDVFRRIREGDIKELQAVLKADTQGSAEAVKESLQKINVEGTAVRVIRAGVGQISESDVLLASASNAVIIGFRVGVTLQAKKLAEQERVQIKLYDIIYKLIEDVQLALSGLLEPEIVEVALGTVEIRAVFRQERDSVVAGGIVLSGKAQLGALYRLRRNSHIVAEGKVASLRRFKDDVQEVAEGVECGLMLEGVTDVQPGDNLELFIREKRTPTPSTKTTQG